MSEYVSDEELNYEHLTGQMITLKGDTEGNLWKSSAIAILLIERMCAPVKKVSSDTGYDPPYLRKMVKTFLAFPNEEDRAQDLPFSIHLNCALAKTETPEYWLDESIRHAYTVRELLRVMKGKTPKQTPLEIAEKVWAKVAKYLEEPFDFNNEGAIYIRDRMADRCLGGL